jgi:outer membrane protein TolC
VGVFASEADAEKAWTAMVTEPSVTAEVGARLSVPLDQPSVHAALNDAERGVSQAQAELERVTQQVAFAIENARTQLATDVAVWERAMRQQVLAEKKLTAQLEKYQSGLSTLQDVVRFQRELDEALIGLQRVARSVRTGRIRLLAAVGTLHDDVGVGVASLLVNNNDGSR